MCRPRGDQYAPNVGGDFDTVAARRRRGLVHDDLRRASLKSGDDGVEEGNFVGVCTPRVADDTMCARHCIDTRVGTQIFAFFRAREVTKARERKKRVGGRCNTKY